MARLTILQASQQGFGSTLTIHRHIKDGSLPVYEEGDVKLLEVDDLISVLGEPGIPMNDNLTPATEPDQIDIYEYNRMKSELDQKNKKNMWLAADLAEVVRELKEKEAKFEAERTRLLKVLEQAQALLLREAKRAGGAVGKADVSALKIDQVAASGDAGGVPEGQGPAVPDEAPPAPPITQESDMPVGGNPSMPGMSAEEITPPNGVDPGALPTLDAGPADFESKSDSVPSELPSGDSGDTKGDDPPIMADGKTGPRRRAKSRNGVSPVNPLVPPFEDGDDEAPEKSRLLSTTTWIMLITLVSAAVVFFEFRTQVMTSVENIMKSLGGA